MKRGIWREPAWFPWLASTARALWCCGVASVLLALVSPAFAQAPLVVEWKAQRLSVSAERAPLAQVLREVARQTGIEVDGLQGLQQRVSVRFTRLALRDGLAKLLAHQDYAMVGDPSSATGGEPVTLVILGHPPSPAVADAPRAETGSAGAAEQMALSGAGPTAPASAPVTEQDPAERAAAVYALANDGDMDAIRRALLDPDPGVQAIAFQALAERDPHEAARMAVDASRSDDLSRRLSGLFALGQLDDTIAVPALAHALADADEGVREYAVQSLRGQSSPEAEAALSRALQDASPAIRLLALEALACRGRTGEAYLRSAAQSEDSLLRARAAQLLQQVSADERDRE